MTVKPKILIFNPTYSGQIMSNKNTTTVARVFQKNADIPIKKWLKLNYDLTIGRVLWVKESESLDARFRHEVELITRKPEIKRVDITWKRTWLIYNFYSQHSTQKSLLQMVLVVPTLPMPKPIPQMTSWIISVGAVLTLAPGIWTQS